MRRLDSNQRSLAYETSGDGQTPLLHYIFIVFLVRDKRFELLTSVESGQRSTSELITHLVEDNRIELLRKPCKGPRLPLHQSPDIL